MKDAVQAMADLLVDVGITMDDDAGRPKMIEAVGLYREAMHINAVESQDENSAVVELEREGLVIKQRLAEALLFLHGDSQEAVTLLTEALRTYADHTAPHGFLRPLGQESNQDAQHLDFLRTLMAIAQEGNRAPTLEALRPLDSKISQLEHLSARRKKPWVMRRAKSALARVTVQAQAAREREARGEEALPHWLSM